MGTTATAAARLERALSGPPRNPGLLRRPQASPVWRWQSLRETVQHCRLRAVDNKEVFKGAAVHVCLTGRRAAVWGISLRRQHWQGDQQKKGSEHI